MTGKDKFRAEAKVIEDEISAEQRYQKSERMAARAALLEASSDSYLQRVWRGIARFMKGE